MNVTTETKGNNSYAHDFLDKYTIQYTTTKSKLERNKKQRKEAVMSQTEAESLSHTEENKTEIIPVDDEDLEDGEIDDSEEEETKDPDVIIVAHDERPKTSTDTNALKALTNEAVVTVIDSSSDNAPTPPPTNANLIKSKKPTPVEDDHAINIENAIAMALKKKGIEPSIPKVLENKMQHNDDKDDIPGPGQGQSKSSRRRKRKKAREEKEKEKERKEKVILFFFLIHF